MSSKNLIAKIQFLVKFALFNFVVVALAFLLCEGTASTIVFWQQFRNTKPVAERLHTQYDAELGWVNIPNRDLKDFYAPGLDVKINSQGFRSDEDFTVDVPKDKIRLICSGDSFTFGFGVSNNQTWCHDLSTINSQLQTVNMALGGYGIDQAYLWYKRDGGKLKHNVHLFAFITADFDRIQRDVFLGYGKPLLKVKDDQLIIENVPVSKRGFYFFWTTPPYQEAFNELRSVQLLSQTFFQQQNNSKPPIDEPLVQAVSWKILEDLAQLDTAHHSKLVLIYLPVQADYEINLKTDTRRRYVEQASQKKGLIYFDLVDEFRKLPREKMNDLFIPNDGSINFPGAPGHYSAKGNQYIAEQVYRALLTQPALGISR